MDEARVARATASLAEADIQALGRALAIGPNIAAMHALVAAAHAGQTDRAGAPYLGHLVRVAWYAATLHDGLPATHPASAFARDDVVCVALAHDVLEDTPVQPAALTQLYGAHIRDAVVALTRTAQDVGDDYLDRVTANPLAAVVKAGDLADNSDPIRLGALTGSEGDRLDEVYMQAWPIVAATVGLDDADPGAAVRMLGWRAAQADALAG